MPESTLGPLQGRSLISDGHLGNLCPVTAPGTLADGLCFDTGLMSNEHGGLFPAGILKAASHLSTSGIWIMALLE